MSVSGSNVSEIRPFRQGINAYTRLGRGSGLPLVGSECDSPIITPIVFGQPKVYADNVPYQDQFDFDPIAFLNDEEGTQTFPAILGNVNLRDPGQMNGVLEPLTIRSKVSMTSTDFPYEARDIHGSFMAGNEDPFRRTDVVKQFVEVEPPAVVVPFIDSDEFLGDTLNGAVKIPGIVSSDDAIVPPFEDQDAIEFDKLGVTLTDDDIIGALDPMDPGSEDLLPNDHKAAGSGFTYRNNVAGTDSIAFGGLTR